jgi:hypothetical protein
MAIINATEYRGKSPRYVMTLENGDPLGYAQSAEDLERQALSFGRPGDVLVVTDHNGRTSEIML